MSPIRNGISGNWLLMKQRLRGSISAANTSEYFMLMPYLRRGCPFCFAAYRCNAATYWSSSLGHA
eukprot:286473-Prorocentrum_lima.AAC.1